MFFFFFKEMRYRIHGQIFTWIYVDFWFLILYFFFFKQTLWAVTAIKAQVELIILTMAQLLKLHYHLIIQRGTNPRGKIGEEKSNLGGRCHLSDLCLIDAVTSKSATKKNKKWDFLPRNEMFFYVMSWETWSVLISSDAETLNLFQTLEAAAPYRKLEQTHRSMTCLFLHSQSEKSDPSPATRDLSWRPV